MEYLDIVNEDDEVVGKEERDKVHKEHLMHRSVQIILVTSKNEIVLQLRNASKKEYPMHWTVASSGHVSSGEDPFVCAKREVKEEIGVDVDIKYLTKFIIDNEVEYEVVYCYFGKCDGPFVAQESEVEMIDVVPLEKFKKEFDTIKMTPHAKKGLEYFFENVDL